MKNLDLARALVDTLISSHVENANGGGANVVDVLDDIANALRSGFKWLGNGDACTRMGAIEAHGMAIVRASENIASAIRELAEAVEEVTRK